MRNNINTFIFIAFVSFVLLSCKKDFLETKDPATFNKQTYVKDISTLQEFLDGIYLTMQSVAYEHGIGAAYPELIADNLMPQISGAQNLPAIYSWAQISNLGGGLNPTASNQNVNGNWRGLYFIARNCSYVIEQADRFRNENASKADYMKGQAYAIRALVHFKLVNIFAQPYNFSATGSHLGVPYITTSDITKEYGRQTVAKVYNELINDLQQAISFLPANATDIRLVNKNAARAFLARVYLFKSDYVRAKSLASELTNEFPLMTINNGYPNDIFKNRIAGQTEVFFQLRPIQEHAPFASLFLGNYLRGSAKRYIATSDIATILRENTNDVRSSWVASNAGRWDVTKFPTGVANETPAISNANTAYYPPVIRSSEMYLTVAEAAAKLGDEATAHQYLNAIRKRANPTAQYIAPTGQSLLDSIYKERRKELCFEGLRMYDLQRWNLGVHRIDVHPNYLFAKDLNYPSEKAIAPIPLDDVQVAGLQQNSGY